jgi:hypothetical protein
MPQETYIGIDMNQSRKIDAPNANRAFKSMSVSLGS